jgi:hypothetical protein
MRRFTIFVTALLVLVVVSVGSRPQAAASQKHSFCACMASRAALLMRSIGGAPGMTTAQARPQPPVAETASAE